MNSTTIEWVRNPGGGQGFTSSPITGCLGPDGRHRCPYCFAEKLAKGRLKTRYLDNMNIPEIWLADGVVGHEPEILEKLKDPFYPRFWPVRLAAIEHRKEPAGIFLCDMGEWAGPWVPGEWYFRMFETIRACPQHLFYLLSKQYRELPKFNPYPKNCRVGMSVTYFTQYGDAVYYLPRVVASHKFISFEPLLQRMSIEDEDFRVMGIDQVIIGGKSGKDSFYPPEEWIQQIELAADRTTITVFEKDNLRSVWQKPARQEMP